MRVRSKGLLDRWLKKLEIQLDLEQLMVGCCKALLELSEADRISIMVLDGSTEELSVRWAHGARVKPHGRNMKFRMGEGLCGWVARSQKAFCVLDATKDPRFVLPPRKANGRFRPVKTICCLPLVVEGQTVGVVNLSSFSSSRRFLWLREPAAQRFLQRLGQVIAQAVLLREMETASQRWRLKAKVTSETVAQVSHEIRTPLTLIMEGTQQLLDGLGGSLSSRQTETLRLVKNQSERMIKLVTELLDVSRIEAGRMVLHRKPMDLAEVVREVQTHCQPLILSRKLKLAADSIPAVYGDRVRLGQVVENLLTNAIKFTPAEGSITVSLNAHGRSAELSVSDTGIGIPKKEQYKLFQKFFQPKAPDQIAQRGTGLGLTIVKEIVQLHGGTIRAASEPGQGTTFTVSLPLYTPAFALTEEFRVMREQAAREGTSLACQVLWAESNGSLERSEVMNLLRRHISREDRVLVNPEGGLVLLSVTDSDGFQAIRQRLEAVLGSSPEWIHPERLRWGSAFVPEEGSELAVVLKLAQRRAREQRESQGLLSRETKGGAG
ncbi:MAG: GAF domain-containing sensor histidine kinase [Candidatus Omnitrophica bacterium]|nr:GAF domain-containing sensor histidine kinase [Candidatus Omnitrophota bacterium]